MTEWIAIGILTGIGVLIFLASYLGYRQRVRWYEDYDRRHPGVAEQLGVSPRRPRPDYDPRIDYPERYTDGPI